MIKEESVSSEDIFNAIIENQVALNGLKKQLQSKNRREYIQWSESNRSSVEFSVQEKAFEFEEQYFQDMSLKEYLDNITKIEYEDGSVEIGNQDIECALTLEYWKFFVVPNGSLGEDACADCTYLKKQIRIIEDDKNSDITLLHELIHAFDDMLKEFGENYYSYVFLRLYDKLRGCIPDLIDKISIDNHILLVEQGHNPMFLLKSFDLDLRLNLPLGTIYAYNREEYFNNK